MQGFGGVRGHCLLPVGFPFPSVWVQAVDPDSCSREVPVLGCLCLGSVSAARLQFPIQLRGPGWSNVWLHVHRR